MVFRPLDDDDLTAPDNDPSNNNNYDPLNDPNVLAQLANQQTPPMSVSQATQQDLPKGLQDMHATTQKNVLFRDNEMFELMAVLNKHDKPNAIIVAEPGAGKSALVEGLVALIQQKDPNIPTNLKDKHIYELSLTSLVSGSSLVGQVEQNIENLIAFATNPDNNAILFIDEAHRIAESSDPSTNKLSQSLKPLLSRSDMHIIGATTTGESKQFLSDPALMRRFETVRLKPLSVKQTESITKSVAKEQSQFHNIMIPDELIPDIVALADQYYLTSARPDNALTLLDQAASRASLTLQQATANVSASIKATMPNQLTKNDLIKTINSHTGNSATLTPHNLADRIKTNLIGQDDAIDKISKQVILFRKHLIPTKQPLSLLLAGPTGNGKTQTVKELAKAVYHDQSKVTTIDMTNFSGPETVNTLLGSPDGYIGSDSKTPSPFDEIYQQPDRILHLEEFEKAHADVMHLFYSILEEGYIEDRRGRKIDFSHTIIIASSNAETESGEKHMGFSNIEQSPAMKRKELILSLSKFIPEALLNRFTEILVYSAISKDAYQNILEMKYESLVEQIINEHPTYTIDKPNNEIFEQWVSDSYNPKLNGRPAEKYVKSQIENAFMEALNQNTTHLQF